MLLLRRSLSQLRVSGTAAAGWKRPLSSVSRGGYGGGDQDTDIDKKLEKLQDDMLDRFQGPLPVIRLPIPPPIDAILETWAPKHLVSENPVDNILNFRTKYMQQSSDWDPPEMAKVVMRVNVWHLGLNRDERKRLISVVGPGRYSRGGKYPGMLKLTCSTHMEPHKNKVQLRKTLAALILDAKENGRDFEMADDSTKPLIDRVEPWQRGKKSTAGPMIARPPRPLINDWRKIVQQPPQLARITEKTR